MRTWSPQTWRSLPARHQPSYADPAHLAEVLARLSTYPPIVGIGETRALKTQLAEAARGERFLLQGGDCAERFDDCNTYAIVRKLKILLQMSLVITYRARRPVVRVGRLAGQFAKPRSSDEETIDGVSMPTYRGDQVNELRAELAARRPDPARLERAYFHSAATLNFLRALVEGGFASLRSPEHWTLDYIPEGKDPSPYREIADRIGDAIDYLGILGGVRNIQRIELFTSHEGLLLPYEEALTRKRRDDTRHFDLSAHFLWIGERTRGLDEAHVEFFRGIGNPIGVKVGPSTDPAELTALCERLNPDNEEGRLALITRLGKDRVGAVLPKLVQAVRDAGRHVAWVSDPMHGNTRTVDGFKTRDFADIEGELRACFEVHRAEGSHLAGVHFELTGENVTECVGGPQELCAADLRTSYETGCDPRLNYGQSLEMAFLIGDMLAVDRQR